MKDSIRIGCGAGFAGDRLDPALVLVREGQLDFLVLECLAERTIALSQKRKRDDPNAGYDPLLEARMRLLLPELANHRVRLITNMGAANPVAGADKMVSLAKELGVSIRVAAVTGDDVLHLVDGHTVAMETGRPLTDAGQILSANAYLGAGGILEALQGEADIVITGRVADPALFIAPMMHAFGWSAGDLDSLAKGTVIGHLMECAGQITGGYFADPGMKDVPDMDKLGHPIAEVHRSGRAVIGKVAGTGGLINLQTAKEQLLYEVVDPHAYITPDVIADFTSVQLAMVGENGVEVSGGHAAGKPEKLKVSVGYQAHYLGEGEITYAGANAVKRAQLAGDTVRSRLHSLFHELRVDLIGMNSVHGSLPGRRIEPYEVRLRVAGKSHDRALAARIGEEVEALYTNGPAGGGGARKYVHDVVGILSVLVPREEVIHQVTYRQT